MDLKEKQGLLPEVTTALVVYPEERRTIRILLHFMRNLFITLILKITIIPGVYTFVQSINSHCTPLMPGARPGAGKTAINGTVSLFMAMSH